ncbi:hypothetical protein D3C85_650660 [compost metagenome]
MHQNVASERRIAAGGRQRQADAGQAEVGEAVAVIQAGAERQGGGVVQIAHQRAGDRTLLLLGQDGAVGGQVVGASAEAEIAQGRAARSPRADRGDGRRLTQQGRQGRVDLACTVEGRDIAHQIIGRAVPANVALGLEQGGVVLVFEIQGPALLAGDAQDVALQIADRAAALVRAADAGLHGQRAEVGLEDEVHHPLVGAVAIGEGGLFGQDLGAFDGFGRDAADFLEAGDATPIDQEDRRAAARTARHRLQKGHQFLDAAGAIGLQLLLIQHQFGLVVAQGGSPALGRHRLDLAQVIGFLLVDGWKGGRLALRRRGRGRRRRVRVGIERGQSKKQNDGRHDES